MSVLTAGLLFITGSPAMPVLCFAHAHTEVEMPFAGCCERNDTPVGHTGVSQQSSAPNCGNCTDVPLISAAVPHATRDAIVDQTACIIADAPPSVLADAAAPRLTGASLAPPASATPPVSLRC